MNLKRVPVNGLLNLRDLGGYPAAGGKATKWRTIYRTDGLFGLENSDIEKLINYCAPGLIIDLRGSQERKIRPNIFENPADDKFLGVPLICEERDMDIIMKEWDRLDTAYGALIEHSKKQIKQVFTNISLCMPKPVIYNCTAGKDRTGVISGLILGLCGVEYSDIIADYEVSATYIKTKLEKVIEPGMELNMEHVASPPEIMKGVLDYIDNTYGDIRKYLISCGISQKELNKIEQCFLEDLRW